MGESLSTRRRVLLGGLGLALLGATGSAADAVGDTSDNLAQGQPIGLTGPAGTSGASTGTTAEQVYSAARGRMVDLVVMRPSGVAGAELPVCLVLHGKGGTARGYLDWGLPAMMTTAVRHHGVPPFAAVAVDLGASYLMDRNGDNPMKMLLEELPAWLDERELDLPRAALGFSMGGFGALCYARHRRDLNGVALASPALFQHWADARKRNCFTGETQWREFEPLQHVDATAGVPLGVWCGNEDSFAPAVRELIAKVHPEVGSVTKGGHNTAYWLRVLPDIMRFIGTHLNTKI